MDEEIQTLVVGVRADVAGFARDAAALRTSLEQPLGAGAERAGRAIESALLKAVRTGKLSFDDLGRVALSVLDEIARAALSSGLAALGLGGVGGGGGGLLSLGTGLIGGLLGLPGRATGGAVSPGRAYVVGERGPELFVPATSGAIAPSVPGTAEGRAVSVSIAIRSAGSEPPRALAQSARQVARAVRAALD